MALGGASACGVEFVGGKHIAPMGETSSQEPHTLDHDALPHVPRHAHARRHHVAVSIGLLNATDGYVGRHLMPARNTTTVATSICAPSHCARVTVRPRALQPALA